MAIQNRRGKFTEFDPSRMVPGEWAVVLDEDPSAKDGRSVYICFAAGSVKRMSTHEDMVENVAATIEGSITDIKKRLTEVVEATDAQIKAAEAERVTAEQGRVAAEAARVEAEEARVTAEQGRSTAELARVEAEKQRELRQAKNDADQAQNNEAAKALTYHICQPGEYSLDAEGQHNVPTITGKNGVVYWTPVVNKDHEYNRYDEWAWVDGAWELKDESKHVAPVTTDDIDKIVAGQAVTSTRVVDTTGLSYLWAKLGAWAAAKFSAKSHQHGAGDITSGTLPIARGGTGGATAEAARAALGASSQADTDALRESLSQIFQTKGKGIIGDLNDAPFGLCAYAVSHDSKNTPSGYGVVLTLGNDEMTGSAYWLFQLAFGTDGKVYHRSCINDPSVWGAWKGFA